MIEDVRLKNVMIFCAFAWETVSNVNLGIGENDTGTSNLPGTLYAVSRSFQDFTRFGDEAPAGRWWSELPAETLQGT